MEARGARCFPPERRARVRRGRCVAHGREHPRKHAASGRTPAAAAEPNWHCPPSASFPGSLWGVHPWTRGARFRQSGTCHTAAANTCAYKTVHTTGCERPGKHAASGRTPVSEAEVNELSPHTASSRQSTSLTDRRAIAANACVCKTVPYPRASVPGSTEHAAGNTMTNRGCQNSPGSHPSQRTRGRQARRYSSARPRSA